MRLMSKGEYLIIPKGTKFTGSGKLGLKQGLMWLSTETAHGNACASKFDTRVPREQELHPTTRASIQNGQDVNRVYRTLFCAQSEYQ